MSDWPLWGGQRWESSTPHADGGGKILTAHGSTNTKGSYTELIAATKFPASLVVVHLDFVSSGTEMLADLAIGAGGSEQVIAANLGRSVVTASFNPARYYFPLCIPAGSRLAGRCQSNVGSETLRMNVSLLGGESFLPAPLGRVTTYGAVTADSGGTAVDCGASANTKGAYSQIVAATTEPIRWLSIYLGNQNNSARIDCFAFLDVAIGAGGSEQIILPDLPFAMSSTADDLVPGVLGPFPVNIPVGSRIAVRAQCGTNDATDRTFDVILYGAY